MDVDFTGKVVLVTGASAGIGEATALLFARLGARLALVGRREGALREVAARAAESGRRALPIVADLGTDQGVEAVVRETIQLFGRLDVLVNNAAVGTSASILHGDMASFDEVFNIDVRGVYNLTRLLVPHLIESKGNIVNISSVAATTVYVGSLPYAMAKAALDHFTRLISLELAPKGVRVNTVSPGIAVSQFLSRITGFNDEEYKAWLEKASTSIPMGEPCVGLDIAKMIVHLASDNSRLVTGTIVKAALDHFTRLISLELAPKGVRVNTVSPGIAVSQFLSRITGFNDEEYKAWLEKASTSIPMGEPCVGLDIAKMIVHLASDNSRLVTGTIVKVDGGFSFGTFGNTLSTKESD